MTYIEWIPRVSRIVSHVFPFEGPWREHYEIWLRKNNITPDEYLDEANSTWTFIHNQIERKIKKRKLETDNPLFLLHKDEIEWWIAFVEELKKTLRWWKFIPEYYVIDAAERYQWTVDLVVINEKKKKAMVFDWKTYWIAKKKFNLPNNYKKDYWKLSKVELQLSLYANTLVQQWYEVEMICAVILHQSWTYNYPLSLREQDKIDAVILDFNKEKWIQ
jgi:hypothetical protein